MCERLHEGYGAVGSCFRPLRERHAGGGAFAVLVYKARRVYHPHGVVRERDALIEHSEVRLVPVHRMVGELVPWRRRAQSVMIEDMRPECVLKRGNKRVFTRYHDSPGGST